MFIYLFVSYLMFIIYMNYIYNIIFIKTVYIIRGISGSGKSYLVKQIENENQLSKYNYINYIELNIYDILKSDDIITSKKLVETYNKCFNYFINCLDNNVNRIYITNPFIYKWEYLNYVKLAKSYGYKIKIIELNCQNNKQLEICYNRSENVKNYNILKSQYKQFESDSNSEIYNIQ